MGLDTDLEEMKAAIKKWEDAVDWNTGQGNIITTTHYTLSGGEECSTREVPALPNRIQVRFLTEIEMDNTFCDIVSACWRSHTWIHPGVDPILAGSILVNKEYGSGISYWNTDVAGGDCTRLEELLVHEAGHGFGIGGYELSLDRDDYNKHPINDELAIMSYANSRKYCEPQAYDIVAIMGALPVPVRGIRMFTKQLLVAMALVIAVGCTSADPAPSSGPEAVPQPAPVAEPSTPDTTAKPTLPPATLSPQPFLRVVPPCTPAPGSDVDLCAPQQPIQRGMGGHGEGSPSPQPQTLREQLDRLGPVSVTHLVLRGTYLPNTARCTYGDPFSLPDYSRDKLTFHLGKRAFKCYVDVRANEWLVGTGPSQVTVMTWSFTYSEGEYTPPSNDPQGRTTEEDGLEVMRAFIERVTRQYENREQMLFLGPPASLGSQAWALIHWWNIERQG